MRKMKSKRKIVKYKGTNQITNAGRDCIVDMDTGQMIPRYHGTNFKPVKLKTNDKLKITFTLTYEEPPEEKNLIKRFLEKLRYKIWLLFNTIKWRYFEDEWE